MFTMESAKSNLVGAKSKFSSTRRLNYSVAERSCNAPRVYDSIFKAIGNTPLVKLQRIPKDHGVDMHNFYVKCEYLNPGGSIKDRVGYAMMEDAKSNNALGNRTLLECTSGNTGVSIAMNASLNDRKSLILTKKKCSDEKLGTMRLLGANIVLLKDSVSEMDAQMELLERYPEDYLLLDQFENDINPKAHYNTTAVEIYQALSTVDAVAMGAGTGGTMTGVGARLKAVNPNCIVIAADPDGSAMFHNGERHPYLIEGLIGDADPPITLDRSLVDACEVVNDKDAFLMARELAVKEGVLCGGSSGMALQAAIQYATKNRTKSRMNIVVILPDGIRNYMTKFVTDQWMEAHFFIKPPEHTMKWYNHIITDSSKDPIIEQVSIPLLVPGTMTCEAVMKIMEEKGEDVAVIVDKNGYLVGATSKDTLRYYATNPTKWPEHPSEEFDWNDAVANYMEKYVYSLPLNCADTVIPTGGLLSRMLDIAPFVVMGDMNCGKDPNRRDFTPKYIVKASNLTEYIFSSRPNPRKQLFQNWKNAEE